VLASDDLGEPRVPLLDKGTLKEQSPGQSVRFSASEAFPPPLPKQGVRGVGYRFQVVAFPTAGEASVRVTPLGERWADRDEEEDNLARSVRRSKSALRRFCVHNRLGYMMTLTFRNDPSFEKTVVVAVRLFLKRLRYLGVDQPYGWVIERGKGGRLHVHFACNWWGSSGAVEVCQGCARAALRAARSDIPPKGSFCIGCIWGQGFVGAPSECIGDPRGVALYVSKYAAADFGFSVAGMNRYHVPRGHQPPVVRHGAYTFESAVRLLGRSLDVGRAEVTAVHDIEGIDWHGPQLWTFRWEIADLEGG
jgi:hypothetical protein